MINYVFFLLEFLVTISINYKPRQGCYEVWSEKIHRSFDRHAPLGYIRVERRRRNGKKVSEWVTECPNNQLETPRYYYYTRNAMERTLHHRLTRIKYSL